MREFIWTKDNSLSKSFCKNVIKKFDEETRKYDGAVGTPARVDKKVKDTKDYLIRGSDPIWKEEDEVFYQALSQGMDEYFDYLTTIHRNCNPQFGYKHTDAGYKLQMYEPGGFYDWHHDWMMYNDSSRILVFQWYLNTIKRKDDGYTEFSNGTKIYPKCGRLVFFPATWTFLHRGYPPKVRKYICNGWIFAKP